MHNLHTLLFLAVIIINSDCISAPYLTSLLPLCVLVTCLVLCFELNDIAHNGCAQWMHTMEWCAQWMRRMEWCAQWIRAMEWCAQWLRVLRIYECAQWMCTMNAHNGCAQSYLHSTPQNETSFSLAVNYQNIHIRNDLHTTTIHTTYINIATSRHIINCIQNYT